MQKGIVYILMACLIWGLIFIVPHYIQGYSPIEIALGRYFFYGLLSLALVLMEKERRKFSSAIWKQAIIFGLVCNLIYYFALVLGLFYSNPSAAALILGLGPVTIAFVGNFKDKTTRFRNLIVPSASIFIGLFLVNMESYFRDKALERESTFFLGLFFATLALTIWTWFVIANDRFLKDRSHEISAKEWVSVLGIGTLASVVLVSFILLLFYFFDFFEIGSLYKYCTPCMETYTFYAGCMVLGVICSWAGSYFWNIGCKKIPVALAGQLSVFETVFGLLFVYAMEARTPSFLEVTGILSILFGVFWTLRIFSKKLIGH